MVVVVAAAVAVAGCWLLSLLVNFLLLFSCVRPTTKPIRTCRATAERRGMYVLSSFVLVLPHKLVFCLQ